MPTHAARLSSALKLALALLLAVQPGLAEAARAAPVREPAASRILPALPAGAGSAWAGESAGALPVGAPGETPGPPAPGAVLLSSGTADPAARHAPSDPAPAGSPALLEAEPGVTALAGRVLDTEGVPLGGVRVAHGPVRGETDAQGLFLLRGVAPGWGVLVIDGHDAVPSVPASAPGAAGAPMDHGYYEVRVAVDIGRTTRLGWTSWLPRIDHAHDVAIASPLPAPVTVRAAAIPGLELRLPAGVVLTGPNGEPVRAVGITPIPLRRTPFPLPANVEVPVYFTAQPGGTTISSADGRWLGAQVVYPNYGHELPRARGTFWRYEPDGLGWSAYGTGTVSADAAQVVPDEGTRIYALTGAMFNGAGGVPPVDRPPTAPPGDPSPKDGDPVDLATGLFVHTQADLAVGDVLPLSVARTYRPGDYNRRSFGVGMSMAYDTFLWSANQYQEVDLVSPDGSRVHYTRIIDPANPTDNFWITAHFTTSTPGLYFGSRIYWNGNGWNLVRQDGTLLVYGENGPLQYVQDRFGNRITCTRANGNYGDLIQVSSPNGRFVRFARDSSSRIVQAVDNIGRTVGYAYDGSGRLSTVTDPNGGVTTYTWDASNRVQSIADARGTAIFTNTYDGNDRITAQALPDGTAYQFAYTLDGAGNVTQTNVTDPLGHQRQVAFNAAHYQVSDKRAAGTPQEATTTTTRDPTTNYAVSRTDPLGRTTTRAYDAQGNVTSVTRLAGTPNAVTSSYTYQGPFNELLTATDPLGRVTTIARNGRGQAVSATDPLGHTTSFTYNAQGQVQTVTDALNYVSTFTYDRGDLAAVTDPLGRTATFYTDAIGRRLRATDPLGNQAQIVHDRINGVQQTLDPLGAATAIAYDPIGNVASVTDARGAATAYTYDARARLLARTDPLGHADQVTSYDGNGNPLASVDRKGQATTRTFDVLGRLSSVSYADGSTTALTLDLAGRLTQLQDSLGGTVTRSYDGLNRLTSETTPQGTVSYAYDAAGRRTSMTVPGQAQVTYSYDDADRLTGITQGTATTSFSYDAANRRTGMTLPNGVVATYGYDDASQLTGITYQQGSTTVGTLTYAYDQAGRISSRSGTLFQSVLPAAVASATYDQANRMTARTASGVGSAPTWDLNGSLTSDGLRSYAWDARNRLTAIAGVAAFAYDGLGRRQSSTMGANPARSYLYDGFDVVQEQTAGAPSANVLTGPGTDERLTRTPATGTNAGTPSTFLADALGSTVALVNSAGVVQTTYGYDPYGGTSATGSASDSPYQYAGRENDGTGLYYNRARYYNPSWERFISEDPIGLRGGINRYAYAGSDPVNGRDPSGNNAIALGAEIGSIGGPLGMAVGVAIGVGITCSTTSLCNPCTYGLCDPPPTPPVAPARYPEQPSLGPDPCTSDSVSCAKPPRDAKDKDGAKAPGKPGVDEGFVDPKGGEQWGPSPNGKGNGWVDENGDVWVPTGQAGAPGTGTTGPAHGGPHWDQQGADGSFKGSVYPGGFRR